MKKMILMLMTILLLGTVTACGGKGESIEKDLENNELVMEETNPLKDEKINTFSANDLEGNQITDEIFAENDLTLINIWGTFCSPCVEEIPELQKIQETFKDKNVKVIGIVVDKDEERAKEITAATKVSYTNIIPDQALEEQIVNAFDYVPVTLFINKEGKVLETFVAGKSDFENFQKMIEQLLKQK